jgi:glutathione S-transferase
MPDMCETQTHPVLYSFRRCPYAMRARLAIQAAGFQCELREIVLRDKAPELLEASPKGTVPVLVLPDGLVLEESLEIMQYVLGKHDPDNWLPENDSLGEVMALIAENDGPFKAHLDRTKYANRFAAKGEQVDLETERAGAMSFIKKRDDMLAEQVFLGGSQANLADMAILPFVRQFAHIDIDWFRGQSIENVCRWLDAFLSGGQFKSIMTKYEKWEAGQPPTLFPQSGN